MNNKGFAITTVIYSLIILLSAVMLVILGVLKSGYSTENAYIKDIKSELDICLEEGSC